MARNFPLWAAFCLLARAAGLLMVMAAGADAHAVLTASFPANGAIVAVAPEKVLLRFNETVRVIRLGMVAPDGAAKELSADPTGAEIAVPIPGPLADGTVIVSYRVASEDGHPVGGSIVFHVGKPSARSGNVSEAPSEALLAAIWFGNMGATLAVAAVVGGAFFNRWLDPASMRAGSPALAAVAIVFVLARLYLQGLDDIGAGLVWAGPEPIAQAFSDRTGTAQCLALAAIVLALLPLRLRSARMASAAALVLASFAFTLTGHSSLAQPRLIAQASIFLHAAVMLFWIGSLLPLLRLSRSAGGRRPLRIFSQLIPVPFVLMLLAGLLLAIMEIPRVDLAWSSLFARILAVKIGLVAVLCMLALYNRFWLTAPALAGNPAARRRLGWTIGGEIALALLIVATASLWRFAGPGQYQYAHVHPAMSLHRHGQKAMAELETAPRPDGTVDVQVSIMSPQFDPMRPRSVSLSLRSAALGIEPLKYRLTSAADGTWTATNLPLSDMAGWSVDVQILIDDFNLVHLEGNFPSEAGS